MLCFLPSLFAPLLNLRGSRLRGELPPIDSEGAEGAEGGSPALGALRGTKNPPGAGGSGFSLRAGRQVTDDDIDPSVASVASVGHTGGVITSRSGGMSGVSVWDSVHYPAAFSRSSFGTPSRPAITQRGIS